MINNIIAKLKLKQDLTQEEASLMQEQIIQGKVNKNNIIKIFELFALKEITDEELIGIVNITRARMNKIDVNFDCFDNCGTGGDKLNTFNISTVSALVCASVGIPMAKHGNRAASSKCGSADVLEKLGVKIGLGADEAKKCLEDIGIVFMFAPLFHPALIHVKEARIAYGKKTYFNILGPMLNPAGATRQVIGLADIKKAGLIGNTLIKTGSERVMIVRGDEGMDEISAGADTEVCDYFKGRVLENKYNINPRDFGLELFKLEKIRGGDIKENAKIFKNILKNKATTAQTNAVLLNSAAGMLTFGRVNNFQEGIELAREAIESGKAHKKLKEFITVSNKL